MRFKRGSKVEVMNKREAPVSWSTAEIVSDNGDSYSVRRYYYVGMACEPMVERVSRKLVRPYPPVVQGMENYVTGDIVEMFDNFSWKIANILKVLHGNQYLIKQFGSSQESIIPRSNIRLRQTWHEDKWIMMGKSCGRLEGKVKESSALNGHKNKSFMGAQFNARDKIPQEDWINIQNYVGFRGSPVVSSRSRKRMFPYCSSIFEADTGNVQKIKAIEKEGQRRRIAVPILEKGHHWMRAPLACSLTVFAITISKEPSLSEANREVHCKGLKTAKVCTFPLEFITFGHYICQLSHRFANLLPIPGIAIQST